MAIGPGAPASLYCTLHPGRVKYIPALSVSVLGEAGQTAVYLREPPICQQETEPQAWPSCWLLKELTCHSSSHYSSLQPHALTHSTNPAFWVSIQHTAHAHGYG